MNLAMNQGPVHAPALFSSRAARPWHMAGRKEARIEGPHARRRPIGLGARTVLVTDPASVAHRRLHTTTPPSKRHMKRTTLFLALLLAVTASLAAMGIGAAVDTSRTLMSREDYRDALRGIESASRGAIGQCRSEPTANRELCKAKVRADERVRKAELQARYYGTASAADEVQVARVKAKYDVARAECAVRSTNERLDCLRNAREARAREIHAKVASAT